LPSATRRACERPWPHHGIRAPTLALAATVVVVAASGHDDPAPRSRPQGARQLVIGPDASPSLAEARTTARAFLAIYAHAGHGPLGRDEQARLRELAAPAVVATVLNQVDASDPGGRNGPIDTLSVRRAGAGAGGSVTLHYPAVDLRLAFTLRLAAGVGWQVASLGAVETVDRAEARG